MTAWTTAIRLAWRYWRTSRRLGVPFSDVLEMDVKAQEAYLDEHKRRMLEAGLRRPGDTK